MRIIFLALFLTGCTGAVNPYISGPVGYGVPWHGYSTKPLPKGASTAPYLRVWQ